MYLWCFDFVGFNTLWLHRINLLHRWYESRPCCTFGHHFQKGQGHHQRRKLCTWKQVRVCLWHVHQHQPLYAPWNSSPDAVCRIETKLPSGTWFKFLKTDNRSCQSSWFLTFQWIDYNEKQEYVFCFECARAFEMKGLKSLHNVESEGTSQIQNAWEKWASQTLCTISSRGRKVHP